MSHRKYLLETIAVVVLGLVWASVGSVSETVPANLGFQEGRGGRAPDHWRVAEVIHALTP